jgi:hypothetical protein
VCVRCASRCALVAARSIPWPARLDLIQFFAAKRIELATKIDRGEMTEQQGQVDTQKIYASI